METLETLIQRHNLSAGFTLIPARTDRIHWEDPKGPGWARPMHFAFTLSAEHGGITGCYSMGAGHLPSYPHGQRTISLAECAKLEKERERFRPTTLDLVCSLLWDASIDPEMTFREWCEERGEGLAPADALDTFQALQETRAKMRRILRDDFDAAVALAQEM